MSKKIISSSKGITLVEVLSVVLLGSVIGLIAYSVLFSGLKTYDRAMEEAALRDEADYILAHLIDELFVLKVSEIKERKLPDPSGNYFLIKHDGSKIGFDHEHSRVVINNKELSLTNGNIVLSRESKLIETEREDVFEILLVLQSAKTQQTMKLKSIVSIIDDRKGVQNNNENLNE